MYAINQGAKRPPEFSDDMIRQVWLFCLLCFFEFLALRVTVTPTEFALAAVGNLLLIEV